MPSVGSRNHALEGRTERARRRRLARRSQRDSWDNSATSVDGSRRAEESSRPRHDAAVAGEPHRRPPCQAARRRLYPVTALRVTRPGRRRGRASDGRTQASGRGTDRDSTPDTHSRASAATRVHLNRGTRNTHDEYGREPRPRGRATSTTGRGAGSIEVAEREPKNQDTGEKTKCRKKLKATEGSHEHQERNSHG